MVQFLFNNKTGEWFVAFYVKTGHQIIDNFVIYNLLLIIQFNNFLLNLEEEEIDQSNPPFFAFNLFSNDILTLKSSKRFSTIRVYFNRSKMRYRRTTLTNSLSLRLRDFHTVIEGWRSFGKLERETRSS